MRTRKMKLKMCLWYCSFFLTCLKHISPQHFQNPKLETQVSGTQSITTSVNRFWFLKGEKIHLNVDSLFFIYLHNGSKTKVWWSHSGLEKLKKSRQKNLWNQINQFHKNFFDQIPFFYLFQKWLKICFWTREKV